MSHGEDDFLKVLAKKALVLDFREMNHLRKKDHIYDVIIIGAGLSGLVSAAALIKKGLDVCVLESTEFPGGHSRLVYSPLGLVDNGIKFFPDRSIARESIEALNGLLTNPVDYDSIENGPLTYHNGEIKPFVGFGKEAPEFHREISYFLENRRLELSKTLGYIVADLAATVGDRFYPGSLVTKYLGEGNHISSVMVNGQRQIFGREFIHATSPKILAQLLGDDLLGPRAKQKIAKAQYWTTLGLDLFHRGEVTSQSEMHLLNGTTQDEIGPCIGYFNSPMPSDKVEEGVLQHSQWMTFVDFESSEDPEVIGAALKKIKRQIKRAYPEAMEKIFSERIMVTPLTEAELDLKFSKNETFVGIDNLRLAHGTAGEGLNIVSSLQQALKVAGSFEEVSTINSNSPDVDSL